MKKTTLTLITIATLISGCGDPAAERAAAEAKKAAIEAERVAAEAKKAAVEAERSLSEIKQAVLVGLKDPDSAKFGKLTKAGDNYACLDVNAKNTFGGYTGIRAIALKCHLFSLDPSLAKADMPLKFTTREYRLLSVTYASIL